jgi:hypothetical protein
MSMSPEMRLLQKHFPYRTNGHFRLPFCHKGDMTATSYVQAHLCNTCAAIVPSTGLLKHAKHHGGAIPQKEGR